MKTSFGCKILESIFFNRASANVNSVGQEILLCKRKIVVGWTTKFVY